MKTEVGITRPAHFKEYWPGMYGFFSHYEYVSNVPQPLFLITTLKENGKVTPVFTAGARFPATRAAFTP